VSVTGTLCRLGRAGSVDLSRAGGFVVVDWLILFAGSLGWLWRHWHMLLVRDLQFTSTQTPSALLSCDSIDCHPGNFLQALLEIGSR
jgi:hypothetical protein